MKKHIFENTKEFKVATMLENAGYQAFFVGGCVRDFIISNKKENFIFEDIDIATNASPKEVKETLKGSFKNFDFVGSRFGVLIVDGIEVAQFRSETYNENSKGKPNVTPANSAYEDAIRRDFTMNSLYMNIKGEIIDFNNGIKDIENKTVKAIGNPNERFNEDPSRILRLFYLASRFGFSVDENTLESVKSNKHLLKEIPNELVGKIIKKVVSNNKLSVFLKMLYSAGIYSVIFPEFAHTLNKQQNPKYHDSDVFNHTVRVIEAAEAKFPCDLTWAMKAWTHDIAKGKDGVRTVSENGQIRDLGHEEVGAPMSKEFCIKLGYGSKLAKEVEFCTLHHGLKLQLDLKERSYKRIARKFAKQCSNKEELLKRTKDIVEFRKLDADGFAPSFKHQIKEETEACDPKLIKVIEKGMFFSEELPIKGGEVAKMWTSKEYLKFTRNVLQDMLLVEPRTKEDALKIAMSAVKRYESKGVV